MTTSGQRPELVSAMLEPGFYPDPPPAVELRETHISWVFLAGDRAYKVKKPLVLPFLDYGTLERRREMCHEEVRLNRRLAPQIYLRVVAISRAGAALVLAPEPDPDAVEYAVEMIRVDERHSLAALVAGERLTPSQISETAAVRALFHAQAAPAPPERAEPQVLEATLDENVSTLREAGGGLIDPLRLDAIERFTGAFLAARRAQLRARAAAGLVRDCHGDLRAEHVVLPPDAPIYVYDCVEFNPELRQIDVAADIAFLVMDLMRLGAGAAALALLDGYRHAGGDPGDDALLFFFASYRAWVRAKVACLRAGEIGDRDPGRAGVAEEARSMIDLGHRLAWLARRPLALVLCGVAATGKTTVAAEIGRLSGWEHHSSDLTRKRLAGLEPTARGPESLYSRETTIRTYRELGAVAAESLRAEGGVIVDATFHLREERDAFRAGLGEMEAPVLFVECRASPETLRRRARRRESEPGRVSDADTDVVEAQLASFEALEEVEGRWRARLETEQGVERLAAAVEALVDERIWAMASAVEESRAND